MAEELDIRTIWNKGKAKEDPSSLAINMLEKKGTKTTLYWIKIILWIEFGLTIVGSPIVTYHFYKQDYSTTLVIIYPIICALYLFYYLFLIRQINAFSYDGNIVQSLRKVYRYLRFYLLHYQVVIWVSLIAGYISGFLDPANQDGLNKIETVKQWLVVIGLSAVLLAIIGGIFHFLIHLIYGRKIKRLRRMVKDLEVEE